MNNIRKNGIVGVIEEEGLVKVNLHFSEWWNGEGLDFNFDDKRFELHIDEIGALVTAAVITGMVDVQECVAKATAIKLESERRQAELEKFKNEYTSF